MELQEILKVKENQVPPYTYKSYKYERLGQDIVINYRNVKGEIRIQVEEYYKTSTNKPRMRSFFFIIPKDCILDFVQELVELQQAEG